MQLKSTTKTKYIQPQGNRKFGANVFFIVFPLFTAPYFSLFMYFTVIQPVCLLYLAFSSLRFGCQQREIWFSCSWKEQPETKPRPLICPPFSLGLSSERTCKRCAHGHDAKVFILLFWCERADSRSTYHSGFGS